MCNLYFMYYMSQINVGEKKIHCHNQSWLITHFWWERSVFAAWCFEEGLPSKQMTNINSSLRRGFHSVTIVVCTLRLCSYGYSIFCVKPLLSSLLTPTEFLMQLSICYDYSLYAVIWLHICSFQNILRIY
jgi:hypothetical protein